MITVSIDIDEPLRDFTGQLIKIYEQQTGKKAHPKPTYDIGEWFDEGREWINNFYRVEYPSAVMRDAPTTSGAENLTHNLHSLDVEVILNSSQPTKLLNLYTLQWVHDKAIYYDGIVFLQNKAIIKCDFHLDDSIEKLHSMRQSGAIAVAFDRPWNQDWVGLRVHTHQEFIQMIKWFIKKWGE